MPFELCDAVGTLERPKSKQPLTRVSKRVPGVYGKRGLERGCQKRLAKGWRRVGEGLAKGWRRVGEGLAKGRQRVGEGLADFLAPSNFAILETRVCDSMENSKLIEVTTK